MDPAERPAGRGNPVLRGDLRARTASRKLWTLIAIYLGILGALVFLGLPPELGRFTESHETSLYVAVIWVELVCIAYCASACLAGEIAVEGEKNGVDLLFAPFSPGTIVAGKSEASLIMIVFWLLLGLPLLALAAGIRQVPLSAMLPACALIGVVAWGIAQIGLLYAVLFEAEFVRTLVHWGTLIFVFVGTAGGPPLLRLFNPLAAATRAAAGEASPAVFAGYAVLGLGAAVLALVRLGRLAAA